MSLNKEKNFVSAVVYLYNNEKEVGGFLKTVNDLLKENFEKYEIVCVNDCSTDGTVKAVENFCEENSVKSLTLINTSFFQGVESAMVAGLDISIGDFVLEFDSPVVDYPEDMITDSPERVMVAEIIREKGAFVCLFGDVGAGKTAFTKLVCKYLDVNNKKEGKVNGCLYYCKLRQEYVYGCDGTCEKFENERRDSKVIEKIYKEGKEYDDINASPEVLLIIIIILVIMGMVMGVF